MMKRTLRGRMVRTWRRVVRLVKGAGIGILKGLAALIDATGGFYDGSNDEQRRHDGEILDIPVRKKKRRWW